MFDPKKKTDYRINQEAPVDQEALIQMYLEEGLSYDEAVAAAQATSGLDMDISKEKAGRRHHERKTHLRWICRIKRRCGNIY